MMNFYEGDNFGSISKIDIALHSDFASFDPASFQDDKSWTSIPFKDESGRLGINNSLTPSGIVYTYKGSFFIHHLRDEIFEGLDPYRGQKSVLRLTDMNGKTYIIGAPGFPVTLSVDGDTGMRYIDENGAAYSFTVEQPFPHFSN